MANRQYVSTISTDDDPVVVVGSNQTSVTLELGEARNVGRSTYIRSNYAARHNFAAQQYNRYESNSANKKRYMRGGRFFLYTLILLALLITSAVCASMAYGNQKYLGAVPIVISFLYLLITCYNWHIHRTNGSLFHEHMFQVPDRNLPGSINKHFRVPVHARIQNRQLIAASDGNVTAALVRLQQQNHNLTEIDIMLYKSTYRSKYASFPSETIIHFILFCIPLLIAIRNMSI